MDGWSWGWNLAGIGIGLGFGLYCASLGLKAFFEALSVGVREIVRAGKESVSK